MYIVYGAYYGLSYGTAKALVADLVPAESRGMAYGTYNAVLGLTDLPASFLAGILWSGVGQLGRLRPGGPLLFRRGHGFSGVAAVRFLEASSQGTDLRGSVRPCRQARNRISLHISA